MLEAIDAFPDIFTLDSAQSEEECEASRCRRPCAAAGSCASGECCCPFSSLIPIAHFPLRHEPPRAVQKTRLPVCTVGDETCQLPCGPCNTRAFIYESAAARLAFKSVVHNRNTTVMSFEVHFASSVVSSCHHS